MTILQVTLAAIFVVSYILITFEHQLKVEKAPTAMIAAVVMWAVLALGGAEVEHLKHDLELTGSETISIILFLLLAMSLVEVLVHYRLFDWIRSRLYRLGLQDRGQFVVLATLTFFLSAALDNLTITIVMTQIALRFFKGKNLLVVVAGIVISANAGGAWSPIGDVTTIMLWLAGKYTASDVILDTFAASLTHHIVATWLLRRQIIGNNGDSTEELQISFVKSELVIICIGMASFAMPLVMTTMSLPPFFGLLFGLATVWILIGIFRERTQHETHLSAGVRHLIAKIDFPSLMFFTGILFAVAALNTVGILELMSKVLLGESAGFNRVIGVNIALGYLSSLVDNVPLTALSINMLVVVDPRLWTLLAYTVGTGGSHLIIGSVAGVVAMGMVPELNSGAYFKIATKTVFVAYLAGMAVWYLQVMMLGF
ncbi:sodium:proton antiporter NhaD [soil metagenome]